MRTIQRAGFRCLLPFRRPCKSVEHRRSPNCDHEEGKRQREVKWANSKTEISSKNQIALCWCEGSRYRHSIVSVRAEEQTTTIPKCCSLTSPHIDLRRWKVVRLTFGLKAGFNSKPCCLATKDWCRPPCRQYFGWQLKSIFLPIKSSDLQTSRHLRSDSSAIR